MPLPPSVVPWLQRLLVAWAASTVASGAVLASAENRRRPKRARKRRRRLKDDADGTIRARARPPVLLGTVAKADAAAPVPPSMTWEAWRATVAARSRAAWRFVTGQPKEGSVDESGARIPDEVVAKDGTKVRLKRRRSATTSATKSGKRRRRGEKREEATLFDSAKESLRQVMKEEAQKAVDEKVEQAGLKKAADVLKDASGKVSETAKDVGARAVDVAQKVKESIPEDANERLQQAGRTVVAGAKSAFSKLAATIQSEVRALEGERRLDDTPIDTIDMAPPAAPDPAPPASATPPAVGLTNSAIAPPPDGATPPTAPTAPTALAPPPDQAPRETAQDLKSAVGDGAKALGDGVQRLGSFLSGPGNPGYQRGSGRRVASGDVVEAKDAPPREPPPGTA